MNECELFGNVNVIWKILLPGVCFVGQGTVVGSLGLCLGNVCDGVLNSDVFEAREVY